jgi:hypothetical protein
MAATRARASSIRWRLGWFTALVVGLTVAALTAAAILEERRVVLAVEADTARSLLSHLASMPEFRSSRALAEKHLAPLREALGGAGVRLELVPSGTPAGGGAVAVQPIALDEGRFTLVYRPDRARLERMARRSALVHVILGAAALLGLLLGTEWILRRRLVAMVGAFSLQVRHMIHGVGWHPRLPTADAELTDLASALGELGPALEEQVRAWVEAERRAAAARVIGQLRQRMAGPQVRALALLGDLQARGLVISAGVSTLRSAVAEVERLSGLLQAEERGLFGADGRATTA